MPETIAVAARGGGSFDAYLALPEERPAPALIVVSSIYGLTKGGKYAVVGFCFGGQHAFLGLTRLGADAGVSYHGTSIQNYLDEALAGKRGEIVTHAGAGHGFAREDSNGYHAGVARASEELAFAMLDGLKTVAVA